MTRDEAIDKVIQAMGIGRGDPALKNLLTALETLGLIAFEEPPQTAHTVIADLSLAAPLVRKEYGGGYTQPSYREVLGVWNAAKVVAELERAGFVIGKV